MTVAFLCRFFVAAAVISLIVPGTSAGCNNVNLRGEPEEKLTAEYAERDLILTQEEVAFEELQRQFNRIQKLGEKEKNNQQERTKFKSGELSQRVKIEEDREKELGELMKEFKKGLKRVSKLEEQRIKAEEKSRSDLLKEAEEGKKMIASEEEDELQVILKQKRAEEERIKKIAPIREQVSRLESEEAAARGGVPDLLSDPDIAAQYTLISNSLERVYRQSLQERCSPWISIKVARDTDPADPAVSIRVEQPKKNRMDFCGPKFEQWSKTLIGVLKYTDDGESETLANIIVRAASQSSLLTVREFRYDWNRGSSLDDILSAIKGPTLETVTLTSTYLASTWLEKLVADSPNLTSIDLSSTYLENFRQGDEVSVSFSQVKKWNWETPSRSSSYLENNINFLAELLRRGYQPEFLDLTTAQDPINCVQTLPTLLDAWADSPGTLSLVLGGNWVMSKLIGEAYLNLFEKNRKQIKVTLPSFPDPYYLDTYSRQMSLDRGILDFEVSFIDGLAKVVDHNRDLETVLPLFENRAMAPNPMPSISLFRFDSLPAWRDSFGTYRNAYNFSNVWDVVRSALMPKFKDLDAALKEAERLLQADPDHSL